MDVEPGRIPKLEGDRDAQVALGTTATLAREAGVPFVPIYVTSTDIAEEILDYTVTYGCGTLIMGKTKRSIFSRAVSGDVVQRVAALLPDEVSLVTRSSDTPFTPLPLPEESEREDEPPPT
jgi:nucleotide-binding universal stress UspA family protein